MCSSWVIVTIAFTVRELAATHVEHLADRLVDNLFDRPLGVQASEPLFRKGALDGRGLDTSTLGKSAAGHVAVPAQTRLAPLAQPRAHPVGSVRAAIPPRSGLVYRVPRLRNDVTAASTRMQATMEKAGPVLQQRGQQLSAPLLEPLERLSEQVKAYLADPRVQEPAKRAEAEMEATMTDPKVLKPAHRVVEQIQAYVTNSNVQDHVKRLSEEMESMMSDPQIRENAKAAEEQIKATMANVDIPERDEKVAAQVEAFVAGLNIEDHAARFVEELKKMVSDPKVREPAKRIAEQLNSYFSDASVQEHAQRIAEQLKAHASGVEEQMHKMIANPEAKAMIERVRVQMQVAGDKINPAGSTGRTAKRSGASKKVEELGRQVYASAAMLGAFGLFPAAASAGTQAVSDLAFADQAGNLAGTFFAASLFPYLGFLYFLRQDANGLAPMAKGGFTYLLGFVFGTIICSIDSTKSFGLSLANVDWLHADAEQLLAFTNVMTVLGLKFTLDGFTSGKITQPATREQTEGLGLNEGAAIGITTVIAGAAVAYTAAAAGGDLGAHAPYLGGFGNLPAGLLPLTEPDNALSMPTWVIHLSSLLEWLVAQGLVWRIALASGNPKWKGLTWAMIPSHSSGIVACTYHVFYNQITDLVLLQSALTFAGNSALAFASYRIAVSNGWKLPALPGSAAEESSPEAVPSASLEAVMPVDKNVASVGSLATVFAGSILASYFVKYGGAALPVTNDAPEWLALLIIAGPSAFNAYKWNERSQVGGDFNGPI